MGFFKEFKEFAMKGNVMDMAVGVIIGGAFGKIVTSLVDDVLMPAIGTLTGGVDFSNLAVTFGDANRIRSRLTKLSIEIARRRKKLQILIFSHIFPYMIDMRHFQISSKFETQFHHRNIGMNDINALIFENLLIKVPPFL